MSKRKVEKVKTLGELVARLLEESGLTAYRMSQQSRVSQGQISGFLRGAKRPTVPTLGRLLAVAGKKWAWLDDNLELDD